MRVITIREFPRKNIYVHRPAVYMELDLEKLSETESKDIPHFNSTLKHLFPGITEHGCGVKEKGGFGMRLDDGTYFGHIIEHIALELQNLAGHTVNYGKTRLLNDPSIYYIVVECKNTKVGREALKIAVEITKALLAGQKVEKKYLPQKK